MVFVALGLLVGNRVLDLVDVDAANQFVRHLAEATLTLVLFTDAVRVNLGRLRRADLAAITGPQPLDPAIDETATRQARRTRLNTRKRALTAQSSARWANAIIAGNDAQHRLARDAQHRHLIGVRAAIATIEQRLAQPTGDTLAPEQRRMRRKAKLPPTASDQRGAVRPRVRGSDVIPISGRQAGDCWAKPVVSICSP